MFKHQIILKIQNTKHVLLIWGMTQFVFAAIAQESTPTLILSKK